MQQTLDVYSKALRDVWYVGLAFALVGFLLVFVEEHVDMRVTLENDFDLEKVKPSDGTEVGRSKGVA